jgi:tetratricopeptide (TPR) repeat protein
VIQQFREEVFTGHSTAPCPKAFLEGMLYWYEGDKGKAHAAFERARIVAEQLVRESPEDAARHGQLGFILAGLGRKEDAIKEGRRGVELRPESQDAFDGPEVTAALAQIYAWTGERDQAFSLLDHLLTTPNGITVPVLKLDPVWDSLRSDPRFQALIDKYGAKT